MVREFRLRRFRLSQEGTSQKSIISGNINFVNYVKVLRRFSADFNERRQYLGENQEKHLSSL